MDINICQIIDGILQNELSQDILLHARLAQYKKEKDKRKRIEIISKAIEEYDYDNMVSCRECLDYAILIGSIIIEKITIEELVE